MTGKTALKLAAAAALALGLAACQDTEGVTAKQPAMTEPMPGQSPAAAAPTNPVTGTVPGTNSQGAAPAATGSGAGAGGGT